MKEIKKSDRKLKEFATQADEDRQNNARLQDQVEKLNNKLRFYKRQIEETEEIAASNLGKYRKAQQELETEGRASSVAPTRAASMRR